jgi:hypothetical protein
MKSPTEVIALASGGLAVDRDLVRRIVLSSAFARSPRLSHFLRYVCTEAEEGRQHSINEQRIGTAVFGRDPDYDSTADSIVRSHASRLRHRLRDYFETEGAAEPVVLSIPKGSYIPRLQLRTQDEQSGDTDDGNRQSFVTATPFHGSEVNVTSLQQDGFAVSASVIPMKNPVMPWQVAFMVALVAALASTITLVMHLVGSGHQRNHIFWSAFLAPHESHTTLVEADSGLVMLQHFTKRKVSLASYISGEYLRDVASHEASDDLVTRLGTRRYMPVVDSAIYEKIVRLLPNGQENLSVRYARDMRLDDLKQGNAILLGTHESDPWVELFESTMNFTFRNNLAAGTTEMVNRHPLAGEQPIYPMVSNDPDHTVYGLVAYRPNLTRTGHVLIVEGETMAGTQTASEFLLDDTHLLPFLKSIQRKDGTIPHFEALIRSSSLGGQSSQIERVAFRAYTD